MATVKQHLSDIEKALLKNKRSNKQLIKDAREEINRLEELKDLKLGYSQLSKINNKINDLLELKKELESQADSEQIKKELNRSRLDERLKKEDLNILKDYYYRMMSNLVNKYPDNKSITFNILSRSDVILDEVKEAKKIYINCYDDEEHQETYFKALERVKRLYKYDLSREREKEQENAKTRQKQRNKLKKGIIRDGSVLALIHWADK